MTSAPPNLLAVRRLLLDHLGPHGLASAEVGIVGDAAHIGEGDSYHLGVPEQDVNGRYSVGESPRDSSGLSGYASALDVGTFSVRTPSGTHTLMSFSRWVVGQCVAGAADTRELREVIYSPDGSTVRRWDRLGKRSTGDSSHLYHTHFSFFRDATKAGRDLTPLFRRYLTSIGLIEAAVPQEDIMASLDELRTVLREELAGAAGDKLMGHKAAPWVAGSISLGGGIYEIHGGVKAVLAQLVALTGRDLVDEPAIIAGVLAGLPPEAIAAAIPTDLAQRVADELAARLQG